MNTTSNTDTNVIEKVVLDQIKPWKVVFYNDDKTTFELVIFILNRVFEIAFIDAEALAWKIHENGRVVVATYDHELAEQKATEAITLARLNNAPLMVTIEQ